MSDNITSNVSTGAPKIGGYAYRAAIGSTLPTDAVTALDSAFSTLGFISEDGVTNGNEVSTEAIKDWGGTTVLNLQSSRDDTWQFTLIESKNLEALKTIFGDNNVSGDLSSGITVKVNADELEDHAYVFEMVMSNNTKKRIVLPIAKVTSIGDITYTKSDAVGYDITLTCSGDSSGNTHYEYMINATDSSEGSSSNEG